LATDEQCALQSISTSKYVLKCWGRQLLASPCASLGAFHLAFAIVAEFATLTTIVCLALRTAVRLKNLALGKSPNLRSDCSLRRQPRGLAEQDFR
jgi:hypothetical protein